MLQVNGSRERATVPSNVTLLTMLREVLVLTGTKNGCTAGECGACTVLMDGEPVNACMVLAVEANGAEIVTVEGLAHTASVTTGEAGRGRSAPVTTGEAGRGRSAPVTTGEAGRGLDALQQAFVDLTGVQCGFCTPGMLISARALLNRNPHPSQDEIQDALRGNLCRCTGYTRIVEAVERAT
ncbi:MAG: (2Fe-2S)-binding protein [Chloroflexi bacterium]|nr:(2Fe-2S)-binding protein [Chloroflexota bacterium]